MGMTFSTDSTGGSSAFSASIPDISVGASRLVDQGQRSAECRRYGQIEGVGDYTQVASAVSELMTRWDPALTQWERSLTSLGTAAAGCAVAIQETDVNLSTAWACSEFGGPAR